MRTFYIFNYTMEANNRRSIYDRRYNPVASGWFIYKLGKRIEDGGFYPHRGIRLRVKRVL